MLSHGLGRAARFRLGRGSVRVQSSTAAPPPTPTPSPSVLWARADQQSDTFILFDGGCHVCLSEVSLMRRLAIRRDAPIAFVDVYCVCAMIPFWCHAFCLLSSRES